MNPVDLTPLADELSRTLAPFLPFLLQAGKLAGEEVIKAFGKEAGEGVLARATQVWAKLRPQVEKRPEIAKDLETAAAKAGDPRAAALLSLKLEELLAALPPETLSELRDLLLPPAPPAGPVSIISASGPGSVAVGGNVTGTIITGDHNQLPQKPK